MVFLSHAHADQLTLINDLAQGLEQVGLTLWYSKTQLKKGGGLFENFNEGIAQSEVALAVLTPNYLRSAYAQEELYTLHNQYIYKRKPLYLLAIGVSVDTIREKYPMLANLYIYSASATEDMQGTGKRMAAYILGKEEEPLPVAPIGGPAAVVSKRRKTRVRLAAIILGGLLAGAGAWAIYANGTFSEKTLDNPEIGSFPIDSPFLPVPGGNPATQPAVTPHSQSVTPEKCLPSWWIDSLLHTGRYRVYLGKKRFATLKKVTAIGDCGLAFTYVPPAGWDVDVILNCTNGTCSGTYDGVLSDGRIQKLTLYQDGSALGEWETITKLGGTSLVDTFAIVRVRQ